MTKENKKDLKKKYLIDRLGLQGDYSLSYQIIYYATIGAMLLGTGVLMVFIFGLGVALI